MTTKDALPQRGRLYVRRSVSHVRIGGAAPVNASVGHNNNSTIIIDDDAVTYWRPAVRKFSCHRRTRQEIVSKYEQPPPPPPTRFRSGPPITCPMPCPFPAPWAWPLMQRSACSMLGLEIGLCTKFGIFEIETCYTCTFKK